MKSPFTGREMSLCKESRKLVFRKDEFDVIYHYYRCEDSGEAFTSTSLDELNMTQLYNQYRAKYRIPFPDKIKLIREKYELSAAKMSEILGFGVNSYRNYESGEVPGLPNAKLIQIADDAFEFRKLVELCDALDDKSKEKLLHRIDSLIHKQKEHRFQSELERYFTGEQYPNSITGFRTPDMNKFAEIVVFFAEKVRPWKTKLNKLLFYADFTMFRDTGFSISGMQYVAIPMGPVPNRYDGIFDYLVNKGDFTIQATVFSDGNIGEQFVPRNDRRFNASVFTTQELEIIERIAERFKDTTTKEIIEISHQEKAWIENQEEHKLIDYRYGFDLVNG